MTDKKSCAGRVWGHGAFQSYQCSKTGTLEHNGQYYCKAHHPPSKKARDDASTEKYYAARAAEKAAECEKEELIRKGRLLDALIAEVRALPRYNVIPSSEESYGMVAAKGGDWLDIDEVDAVLSKYEDRS
jgi:hypothetical protein